MLAYARVLLRSFIIADYSTKEPACIKIRSCCKFQIKKERELLEKSSVKLSHLIQPIIFRHIFCGSCETFTTSTFDSSSQISKREPLIMAPLPFYHIYPQWLHLKLLPILPDASPKKDTDIARSSASIFFRSVLPQVGQRGAFACSAAARSRAASFFSD